MISYKNLNHKLVIDYYKRCGSIEKTSHEFNTSFRSIKKIINQNNIPINGKKHHHIDLNELIKKYKEYGNLFTLSEIYKVSYVTIYNRLKDVVEFKKESYRRIMKIEAIINREISEDITSKVILYNNEPFTYFDSGLTRYVFTNKDRTKVIKILINDDHNYNLEEFEIYSSSKDSVKEQMAKTELTHSGMIIEQEFCLPIKFYDRQMTLQEIKFALSCRNEVGWNKDGKLVCFDLDEFKKY
jgi:hypothetical protein